MLPDQNSNDAEAAALLKEASRLAEIRNRYGAPSSSGSSSGKSIIGWLMKNSLARDEIQANFILLGISLLALATMVWLWWPAGSAPHTLSPGQRGAGITN